MLCSARCIREKLASPVTSACDRNTNTTMKMKMFLVATICIWAIAAPLTSALTFDLASGDSYSNSVVSLRNTVKGTSTCHGVPMLSKKNQYVSVVLQGDVSITLTIHQTTLYVEGYSYTSGGKCYSFIFQDSSSGAESSLCTGFDKKNIVRGKINYKSNYPSLESKAGKRGQVDIGISILKSRIKKVFDKTKPDEKTQAQFLLASVQMVSEATRFTYIQGQVKSKGDFKPNPKMITLENEWDKISNAFKNAPKDGSCDIKDLKDESGNPWKVTNVSQIKGDIGLLNDVGTCKVKSGNMFLDQLTMMMSKYMDA